MLSNTLATGKSPHRVFFYQRDMGGAYIGKYLHVKCRRSPVPVERSDEPIVITFPVGTKMEGTVPDGKEKNRLIYSVPVLEAFFAW
jgi:hypothetical protein